MKHTITASAGAGGSISNNGATEIVEGESITFTVTADAGYKVKAVLVDGVAVTLEEDGTFTLENVMADHTIAAEFEKLPDADDGDDKDDVGDEDGKDDVGGDDSTGGAGDAGTNDSESNTDGDAGNVGTETDSNKDNASDKSPVTGDRTGRTVTWLVVLGVSAIAVAGMGIIRKREEK